MRRDKIKIFELMKELKFLFEIKLLIVMFSLNKKKEEI